MARKRKGRRARGTGTIFESAAQGCWIGRKPIGKYPDGRTRYVEVRGQTQAEVVRRLAEVGPPGPDVTVAAWSMRWLETLTIRPATRANYTDDLRIHILPALGHLRVRDVTPSRVEAFIAALTKAELAATTITKILAPLGSLFRAAVRDELLRSNPVSVARKPKKVRKTIHPFSPDELLRIIGASRQSTAGPLIALLAGTGCRVGEAAALDVRDFAGELLSITRTHSRRHGMGPPKTAQGTRTIRVPDVVQPILQRAVGKRKSGPLFATRSGGRYGKNHVQAAFGSLLKSLGLNYRNPHQLRHSVATALIAAGESPADVAAYLGDRVETVVATYCHATGRDTSRTMDTLLSGAKVGSETPDAPKSKTGK